MPARMSASRSAPRWPVEGWSRVMRRRERSGGVAVMAAQDTGMTRRQVKAMEWENVPNKCRTRKRTSASVESQHLDVLHIIGIGLHPDNEVGADLVHPQPVGQGDRAQPLAVW